MQSLVSASSSPYFDPEIQYSFQKLVIVPSTVYQWKHETPDNFVNGRERVKNYSLLAQYWLKNNSLLFFISLLFQWRTFNTHNFPMAVKVIL